MLGTKNHRLSTTSIVLAKYTYMEERQLDLNYSFGSIAANNFYQGIITSSKYKIQKKMTHFVFGKGWRVGEKTYDIASLTSSFYGLHVYRKWILGI